MKAIKLIKDTPSGQVGIFQDSDGEFLALTFTQSKYFKTEKGAAKWLAKRGYA